MYRRFLGFAAALMIAATVPVGADIDITNPTIALEVANADIETAVGNANFEHRGMGVHPTTGVLYIIDRDPVTPSGQGAGLWTIDVSTGPHTYTQIATGAELTAGITGNPNQKDCGSIAVAADGTVYFHIINGVDSIIRVVPGAPPTVTTLRQMDGVSLLRLSNDDMTLFFSEVSGFGAAANQLTSIPVGGGSDMAEVTIATAAAVINPTWPTPPPPLPTTVGFAPFDVDAAGNLIWFDEAAFGGSDYLLSAVPGGAVTILLNSHTDYPVNDPVPDPDVLHNPGVNAVAVDNNGNIFMFDEFGSSPPLPAPSQADSILILAADGTTFHRIFKSEIDAATGLSNWETKNLIAFDIDSDNVVVYGSDDEADGIISFTFGPAPTSARNWNLFR